MKEIILDVRSSSENDSSTGLCMREVLDRHAYASGLRGDLMFISEGDGYMSERGSSVFLSAEVYDFPRSFSKVLSHGDVSKFKYGGINILEAGTYTRRGVVLSWSRNDSERKRFSDDFKLLGGGERVLVGEVGGDLNRLASVVDGVEIRIGGDGLDGSDWSGKIGDGSIVLTDGELSEYEFLEGEKIVYVADGSILLKEGEFEEGLKVYTVGVELGVSDSDLLTVSDVGEAYLSPVPYVYEHIYLRVGSEGHIGKEQISYFFSDAECQGFDVGVYGVAVSLSSGLVRFGSGYANEQIRYEGLLLGRNGDLVLEQSVSNGGLVGAGSISESGIDSYTGELLGLGYGSVFLRVGGIYILPVVRGNEAKRSDRAYFGEDNRIRVKDGVVIKGQVRGDGTLKLCQSFFPCYLNRVGVSQKKITTGSVETTSGTVSFVDGVITSGQAIVSPSGHLVLDDGVDFTEYNSEIGAVPQGLGTGVVLALRGNKVNGFRSLVDYPVEKRLRVGSTFQFLDFVPRTDFVGYSGSNFFRAGRILKKDIHLEYDFTDRKTPRLGWIEKRTKSAELKEPTSAFLLEAGVLVNSTSIKLSNGSKVETLVEGIDYDLPFNAQGGYARQINELGGERARGFKTIDEGNGVVVLSDLTTYTPNLGDLLTFVSDSLYRQILAVEDLGVSGHRLTLSSGNTYNARGEEIPTTLEGAWYIYAGQKEDIHPTNGADLMRVNDECFVNVPLSETPFLRVYKTYPISLPSGGLSQVTDIADVLTKVSPKSTLFARLSDESDVPLVVLSNEILPTRALDLNSVYYTSGSYKILVDGVENTSFTVDGTTGIIEFDPVIDDLSEVIFQPQPRVGLTDRVEYLNGTLITSPSDIIKVIEEIIEDEYKAQPLTGSISFSQPLLEGVGVEVDYKPESTGVLKRETILFVKTLEPCVRVSAREYTYSTGYYSSVTPKVYLDTLEATKVNFRDGVIDFFIDVEEDQAVSITYVREGSLGGEYTVKLTEPMTKPSFTITEGDTSITLTERGDLSSELENGDVIDFGTHSFFVTGVENNKINFTPPARFNLRVNQIKRTSRNDLFLHVSFENSHHFDTGKSLSSKKYATDILLKGDFRNVIFIDSILVVEGSMPYRIKNVSFLEEGVTKLTVYGYTLGHEVDSFSISIRPVPQEGAITLRPMGAIATDLGVVLIKQQNGLGIPLVSEKDYLLESDTGVFTLFNGHTVKEGVRYTLRYTSIPTVSPTYNEDGTVSYPKYNASYFVRVDATKYEGLPLSTKCTIETKDLFILPIVDEDEYASEIAAQLLQESSTTTGKKQSSVPSPRPGSSIGLYDNLARDVIGRNKIKFYHGVCKVVDDIKTTATGKIVGDQDGGFRFDLEQGSIDYVGAGLEDPITRLIEKRYTPLEYLKGLGIIKTPENNYENLNVFTLFDVYNEQMSFVENEIDDYVFVRNREQLKITLSLPFIETETVPVYRQMWQSHNFSRLFPQSAKFFSLLYKAKKYSYDTTNGKLIGQIENPARQEITNISGISVIKKRPCRMRVIDFKPFGFPKEANTLGKPTFLVSVVPFEDFPYDSNGDPDTDKLVHLGSITNDPPPTISSVDTGNPSLAFRGLPAFSILELGREGEGFSVLLDVSEQKSSDADMFPDLSESAPKKVRVDNVIKGCYICLSGNASSIEWNGKSLLENPPVKGDTLLESSQGDIDDVESRGDTFRVGSDIGVNMGTGEIIDISLPSIYDPNFPLKEIFEQNVPQPLTPIEGSVRIFNLSRTPFGFPALRGEYRNDDGDETIPYIAQLSERELLADVSSAITKILRTETLSQYVYPDEIADDSASISSHMLNLTKSLTPKTYGGIGCKDVEQGDLVLIELDDGATGFIEVSTVDGNSILPPRFKAPVPPLPAGTGNIQYYLDNYYVSGTGLVIEQKASGVAGIVHKFLFAVDPDPTDLYPTSTGLKTFIENATTVGKHNSFFVRFLNQNWNFYYDGDTSSWYFHDGDINYSHIPITLLPYGTTESLPVKEWGFEFVTPTTTIPTSVWNSILNNGGVFSTYNIGLQDYVLDGTGQGGHGFTIDLDFHLNNFYTGNGTAVYSENEGGSQTATIGNDRLTFSEGTDFDKDITHSTATLKVLSCNLVVDGSPVATDINSVDLINDSQAFTDLTITSEGLRVPAFRGYGNTAINKSDLSLSVLVGAKVDEDSLIYEGTDKDLNYDLGAIESSDDLRKILPNDLVFINKGHSAGTHRVLGTINADLTSLEYTVVAPTITELVDNGDGTFNITISAPISDYYTGTPSELGVILNKVGVRNADLAVAVTHGVLLTVDSVSESTFVVSGVVGDLASGAVGETISELIQVGQDIIGFEKIPFDPKRTEIGFDFRNFTTNTIAPPLTGVSVFSSYNLQIPAVATELVAYTINSSHLSLVPNAPPPAFQNVLTGDIITLTVDIKRGIYIDPNFPQMNHDYSRAFPNYFDSDPTQAYGLYDPSGTFSSEVVDVSVRRLRRFGDVFSKLANAFDSLNPIYEVRKGLVQALTQTDDIVDLTPIKVNRDGEADPSGTDTQVGDFADMVSIGDKITVFNSSNEQVMRLKVLSVDSPLKCLYISGTIPTPLTDVSFEVEVRKGMIPHLQSFDKFMDLGLTEVLSSTTGKAEDDGGVKLKDSDASLNFSSLTTEDLTDGHYLIIDPIGELDTTDEYGSPPKGDIGKSGTTGYSAGSVSPFDDNRGVYKITAVTSDSLELEQVVPPEGLSPSGYNILPSVNGAEGIGLRATKPQEGDTHDHPNNSAFSVEPFSYRIVKRDTEIEEEFANSVLFMRERTLSWVEALNSYRNIKQFTWSEYVERNLVQFIGENDKTYLTNEELLGIEGNTDQKPHDVPFVTVSNCLSVLDRRFLIEDPRLNFEGYSEVGDGLPSILENGISFMEGREKRYSWINVRVNQLNGTLPKIHRVDFENPNSKALEDINDD